MKKNGQWLVLIFVTLLVAATNAPALELAVIGPCDFKPLLNVFLDVNKEITLGDLTVGIFKAEGVPFKGSEKGIAQIYNSPIGDDAIEVMSDTELRAYGWCVHVDLNEPAEMPDQVLISEKVKKISWFYAYSLYKNGEWIDYCTPSWKVHSLKYCQSK